MKYILSIMFILINIIIFPNEIPPRTIATIYTVISNENIEPFEIEILGKIKDDISFKDMYLFELKDEKLKKLGGIAEGMSGSPVFVGKNLVGAVSYTIKGSTDIGLFLPLDQLEINENTAYQPGTSVSISPVKGDFYIKSSGTLTYVEGGNELRIYSHALNNIGEIGYFLNKEKDVRIIYNKEVPFKLSNIGEEIGYVYSDEKIGLKGKVAKEIPAYKFDLSVEEQGDIKKVQYEIIKNRNTLSYYLEKSLEIALVKALNKNEYKSVEYSLEIYSDDNTVIFRSKNMLIAEAGILESLSNTMSNEILNVIDNKFSYIDFSKIKLDVKASDQRKIMYIQNISFDKTVYTPGDELVFEITYLIHQFGNIKKQFRVAIPNEFKVGNMSIEISSNTGKYEEEAKNVIEYLYNIENSTKNNEVMVKLKNTSGDILYSKKIEFDYYVISDKIYTQDIIIDSFEAKTDN